MLHIGPSVNIPFFIRPTSALGCLISLIQVTRLCRASRSCTVRRRGWQLHLAQWIWILGRCSRLAGPLQPICTPRAKFLISLSLWGFEGRILSTLEAARAPESRLFPPNPALSHFSSWLSYLSSRFALSMPGEGVEPSRCCHRWILSPVRLPFRHPGVFSQSCMAPVGFFRQRRTSLRLGAQCVCHFPPAADRQPPRRHR